MPPSIPMPPEIAPFHGFVLIDKPAGWTSHDVVGRLRRITGVRRIGHAGTLDPMATGLLVVAVGPATRLLQFLAGHDKTYEGEMTLGAASSTYDALGEIAATPSAAFPGPKALRQAAQAFVGEIEQVPPAHSAIKVGGRKAYDLARRGETVALKPRRIRIDRFSITRYDAAIGEALPTVRFECDVSTGTYIRSLAHDLGQRLGCGAYLSALRRTRVGNFHVDQAAAPDPEALSGAAGHSAWLSAAQGVAHLPQAIVSGASAQERLGHGNALAADEAAGIAKCADGDIVSLLDPRGTLLAVGRVRHADKGRIVAPAVVLATG